MKRMIKVWLLRSTLLWITEFEFGLATDLLWSMLTHKALSQIGVLVRLKALEVGA